MYCEKCGERQKGVIEEGDGQFVSDYPTVMLNPEEQVPHKQEKDSGSSISSMGKPFGIALIIISIILTIVSMMLIGSDYFVILSVFSSISFLVGCVITWFAR